MNWIQNWLEEGQGSLVTRMVDIYVESRKAADKVMASITEYIEGELRLKVDKAKVL